MSPTSQGVLFGLLLISLQVPSIVAIVITNTNDTTGYLAEGGDVTFHLRYTDGTPSKLEGRINGGKKIQGSVATSSITVSSTDIDDFGTHELNIVLESSNGDDYLDVIIYYEVNITAVEVNMTSHFVEVGDTVLFKVTMDTGSNVMLEWYIEDDNVHVEEYDDQVREAFFNYTFNSPLSGIKVIISNNIARIEQNVNITVQYRVSGFLLHEVSYPLRPSPFDDVDFKFSINLSALEPMGSVWIESTFGDNTTLRQNLKDSISTIKANGLTVSHEYQWQGNYTVTFRVYAELNEIMFETYVYIWDTVEAVLNTSTAIAKTDENITFSFARHAGFTFQYLIEYDNGDTRVNSPEMLYSEPLDTTPWTYSYPDPGHYEVKLTAWNPFHYSFSSIVITIQRPLIDESISLSPSAEEIPIPDGLQTFVLSLDDDIKSPTDVYCKFDFGEEGYEFIPPTESITINGTTENFDETTTATTAAITTAAELAVENMTGQMNMTDQMNGTTLYMNATTELPTTYFQTTEIVATTTEEPFPPIKTVLKYASPVTKYIEYLTPGMKNVNFTCYNLVSSITKLSQISVRNFTLSDFKLTFVDMVMMNMTLEKSDDDDIGVVTSDDVVVDFLLTLFQCSRLPPDIEFKWTFGDGKITKYKPIKQIKSHKYRERRAYNVIVQLKSSTENYTMETRKITLGVTKFSIDKYDGFLGQTDDFVFTVSGPPEKCDYYLSFDMHEQTEVYKSKTLTDTNIPFKYSAVGMYVPVLIVRSDTFYERVYLSKPIRTDYSFEGSEITLSNTTIPMPPGIITVSFTVTQRPLPDITCLMQFDDFIDIEQKSVTQNVTIEEPMVFSFNYLTFGTHKVNVSCFNLVTSFGIITPVVVVNECFTYDGIFAWQFSRPHHPLIISTAIQTDLSNRMPVRCYDQNPKFHWKIYRYDDGPDSNETLVAESYIHNLGTYRFLAGSMTPHLHRVSLNVTLDETWALENSYVKFVRPSPFPMISGGVERIVNQGDVTIDATSESYSAERGEGYIANLTFTFFCYRYPVDTFAELRQEWETIGGSEVYEGDPVDTGILSNDSRNCDDMFAVQSNGRAVLNANDMSYRGFLIVLRVDEPLTLPSVFMQMITVNEGMRPIIRIKCVINCREKVAVQNTLKAMVICQNCMDNSTGLIYKWQLKTVQNGKSILVNLNSGQTYTGTNQSSFALADNVLSESSTYILEVTVWSPEFPDPDTKGRKFITNIKPYGGTCSVDPTQGTGMSTTFAVRCIDWKDEGIRINRNASLDIEEPITYEYIQEIQRTVNNTVKTIRSPLFMGNEDSATELHLQIGESEFDYRVTILVRIKDTFGDAAENRDAFAIVKRNESLIPNGDNDEDALGDLFATYLQHFLPLEGGGNTVALVQFIGATGALLSSITGYDNENSTTKSNLTNLNAELMNQLRGSVTLGDDKKLNSADTNNVIQNVMACITNLAIVSDSILDGAVETAGILTADMEKLILKRPFPVEDLPSILNGILGAMDIVDTTITGIVPDVLIDPDKEILIEDIRLEYNTENPPPINGTFTDEEMEERELLILEMYNARLEQQAIVRERSKQANETVTKLVNALINSQDIIGKTLVTGEPETVIERDNVVIAVEKMTGDKLNNATGFNKTGFWLELDRNNTENADEGEELQMQTAVFNKVPHYHGVDASKITSKGIMVAIKRSDGTRKNVSMDMQISNQGVAFSKRYKPTYLKDDPDKMLYFAFDVLSEDDAIIFYILPDNFNPFDFDSYGLYDIYARNAEYPNTKQFDWSYSMNIRDWVDRDVGFKIFIPERFLKAGKAFVALKPMPAPPIPEIGNRMRRRRSANYNDTSMAANFSSIFEPADVNFTTTIVTTGCRTWNEAGSKWTSTGCEVLPFSTMNETICRCNDEAGNIFATTFFVPPNAIDFSGVWAKFDPANAAVYGTLAALLFCYVLVCVWARRYDKKDQVKWTTHFLSDTDRNDSYFYIVSVTTGLRRGSGTKSNVSFVVAGDYSDSGVRILSDGKSQGFEHASTKSFIMGTTEKLGDLNYIRIWHDNSGIGAECSWYLSKITIDDPQQHRRYVFLCDKWFSYDHDDGTIDRILPVCGQENLTKFSVMFYQRAVHGITEDHLWVSALMRPEKSSFTRVQRISCVVMLLFLTMITNAMFFSPNEKETTSSVSIGSMTFSMKALYVSIIGTLMTTVPVVLVALIFSNTKPSRLCKRRKKPKANEEFSDEMFFKTDHQVLPSFMGYVAWLVVFLAIIASTFFLLLYSMEWGKAASEVWLSSFVLSFFESFLFVDPLKVVFVAAIFSFLCRRPLDCQTSQVNLDEVKRVSSTFTENSMRTYLCFRQDVLSEKDADAENSVAKEREQRLNEQRAMIAFIELLFYAVFAFIVYSISYVNRDQRSFALKDTIYRGLNDSNGQFGYGQVGNAAGFMTWLNGTFFEKYFPETAYNGDPIGVQDKFFFSDLDNVKVGPPRLRQVRMKRGKCPYDRLIENRDCIPDYNIHEEDEDSYCVGWTEGSSPVCTSPNYYSMDAWRYQKSEDIWGTAITGEYQTYGGGGYILKLENGLENSRYIAEELVKYHWINRATRAIFLEFTLYNANTNLFLYMIFLTEFTENGGLLTWVDVYPFRPYQHTGALGAYAMLCYFIYLIALIYGTVKIVSKIAKQRWQFLKDLWNITDLSCVILSYIGVVLWCLRYVYASQSMAIYYEDKDAFINFQHVVVWDVTFNVIIGIIVFVATIRLLRIMGYNKRMTQVARVIGNAAADLSGFAIIFGIGFFGWVILGFLLFGSIMREYRSLFSTWGTLSNSLIGKNKLDAMTRAAPNFANFYFFTYVVFIMLILMTVFAAILNQSITTVRSDMTNQPETYGILDIFKKYVVGLRNLVFRRRQQETKRPNKKQRIYNPASTQHRPKMDTTNIMRTVRDIFGTRWDEEEENKEPVQSFDDICLDVPIQEPDQVGSHGFNVYCQEEKTSEMDAYIDSVVFCKQPLEKTDTFPFATKKSESLPMAYL
ncbi:polycystin family receptor for egg jelly-like [Argopecten irradians]|uniref:polycystin family receptor for egg jelly-like n=1 Tax=Argopecten irradians TaxID=31199 RepID=UPI00371D72AE